MSCAACQPGIRGLIRSKLGRCPSCMKLSFVSAVATWAALGALASLRAADPLLIAMSAVALAFTVLWLLHIGTFVRRQTHRAATERASYGIDSSRRAFVGAGVTALGVGLAVSVPGCQNLGVAAAMYCDCYFDSDCSLLWYCRYDYDCTYVPKGISEAERKCAGDPKQGSCDGMCTFLKLPTSAGRETLARAADLYFRAYIAAATQTRFGEPDAALLAEARAVSLPGDGHAQLTGAIFSAIDLTAGWDFAISRRDMSDRGRPGTEGFFRGFPEDGGTPKILEAVRAGFVAVVRTGQAAAIVPPIEQFWAATPGFRPNHGGRCYPHGHRGYATALDCQRINLSKLAAALASDAQ